MTNHQRIRVEEIFAGLMVSGAGLLFASPFLVLVGGLLTH
jgi:hypothetical protein